MKCVKPHDRNRMNKCSKTKSKISKQSRQRSKEQRRIAEHLRLQSASTLNLPQYYPWKVLYMLHQDLSELLSDSDNKKLARIIRTRDFKSYLALSEGEWGLQCIASNRTTNSESHFTAKYQLASLIKKYQFSTSEQARKDAALKKFRDAEAQCAVMNASGVPNGVRVNDIDEQIWHHARTFIKSVIGEHLPSPEELYDKARHGPGSTLSTKGGNTNIFFKYSEYPYSCTAPAKDLAKHLIRSDERWLNSLLVVYCEDNNISMTGHLVGNQMMYSPFGEVPFDWNHFWDTFIEIVPGNRIAFVPKNAQTDRSIAIEPTLNLMLQLGVDGHIRKHLKRFGIDLDSQTKNQLLAKLGSLNDGVDSFCTLDLAAASDTISLMICARLLPVEWFVYLMKLRSPSGVLGDETISYEKISSMGNGFTFAIESLVFSALMFGAQKLELGPSPVDFSKMACFGDDLIIPRRYVTVLITALVKSGFKINQEKSFITGPVRESCGADWVKGTPVRPVFLTGLPQNVKELWTDFNRLQRNLSLRFDFNRSASTCLDLLETWIPRSFVDYEGPISDEDMDSYKHVKFQAKEVKFSFQRYAFKFQRLISSLNPVKFKNPSRDYWFIRLMHDLRPYHVDKYSWEGDKSGKRFEVTSRNRIALAKQTGYTTSWCNTYHEPGPRLAIAVKDHAHVFKQLTDKVFYNYPAQPRIR